MISVEATFGVGEALVSGVVNADVYKVRDGEIFAKTIATPTLTDAEVTRLAKLGREIEAHFGRAQDIEWCLADGDFAIVQSRPITTLYPVPVAADSENHVYVSVGHQQMMTDAMKPLGISMWQLTAATTMHEAGGRLFVDVSRMLATRAGRAGNLAMLGRSDPLIGDALQTIVDRGDFIQLMPDPDPSHAPSKSAAAPLKTDPAIVAELIAHSRASNVKLEREIETKSGAALFDFMLADMRDLRRVLFDPRNLQAVMASVEATWWLNDRLEEWLGEKNAADMLAQSVANNVTSEMGLDLLHVADAIRPHPAVVDFLQHVDDDGFLDELPALDGGEEAREAIRGWLGKYGMRCVGEIDITRPRWSERPASLVPLILGNVRNFEPARASFDSRKGSRPHEEGSVVADAIAGAAERRSEGAGNEVDDRPAPHLCRLPRVSEILPRRTLLRIQARVIARGRAARGVERAARHRRRFLPDVSGFARRCSHQRGRLRRHPRARRCVRNIPEARAAAGADV